MKHFSLTLSFYYFYTSIEIHTHRIRTWMHIEFFFAQHCVLRGHSDLRGQHIMAAGVITPHIVTFAHFVTACCSGNIFRNETPLKFEREAVDLSAPCWLSEHASVWEGNSTRGTGWQHKPEHPESTHPAQNGEQHKSRWATTTGVKCGHLLCPHKKNNKKAGSPGGNGHQWGVLW